MANGNFDPDAYLAKKRGATFDPNAFLVKRGQSTPDGRGAIDKLFGIGGPRYQLWPERAVRGVYGDVRNLMQEAAQAPISPQGGAELAPQAFKVAAETSPAIAPGAASAVENLATGRALKLGKMLPTKEADYASAKAAYKAVQDARLIVHEGTLDSLLNATRAGLDDRFLLDGKVAQRALQHLEKSNGDISGIMDVWESLGQIKPSAGEDYAAAQHIRDTIGNFIQTVPDDEVVSGDPKFSKAMWDHARASWRSYAQRKQVETAMEVGRHKAAVAGTGANTQNAIRQRVREVLDSDKSRRFSPEAKKQMEDIVMGTWATNAARYAGKFAPSGPVSAMAPVAAFLAGGSGERGLTFAAGVAIPATIAKYLGTLLTKRQIAALDRIIASESPLGKAAAAAAKNIRPGSVASVSRIVAPAVLPAASASLSHLGPATAGANESLPQMVQPDQEPFPP